MLRLSVLFLVLAMITANIGFGNLIAGAENVARPLFVILLVLFLVSFTGLGRRRESIVKK